MSLNNMWPRREKNRSTIIISKFFELTFEVLFSSFDSNELLYVEVYVRRCGRNNKGTLVLTLIYSSQAGLACLDFSKSFFPRTAGTNTSSLLFTAVTFHK